MNKDFQSLTASIPGLFATLTRSPLWEMKGLSAYKHKAGVYVFFEGGQPVYVGRTRNLQGRLRGHVVLNHNSASFAFRNTRKAVNMYATYKRTGSRSELQNHAVFRPEFVRQVARVKTLQVRFLEVPDPIVRYLLELYAYIEWKLPLDEFSEH
jgi:hypothetical protein